MFARFYAVAIAWPARLFDPLQDLLLAAARAWTGWVFLKSGWQKATDWETTRFLFEYEYKVPGLSPDMAALAGTAAELAFPVLVIAGLAGRIGALGLSAVNVMAVVSYAHVLTREGFEAALGQHYLWGFMLLLPLLFGPGRLSADYWIARRAGSAFPAGPPRPA